MPIQQTLAKIEREIAAGDYGTARDRLHGLIATYPNDLTLRRKLGQVYWHLQYPAMAGRYWYLEADPTPDMAAACRAFERACGEDPLQILQALKFRGDLATIDPSAARKLGALQARVAERYGYRFDFQGRGAAHYQPTARPWQDQALIAGCLFVALIGALLMIVGVFTVASWLF